MSYVPPEQRRWFEDRKMRGRYLEVYWLENGFATATVYWKFGRPVGASRGRTFRLSTLETERFRGEKRFRELDGAELEAWRRKAAP